MARKKRITTKKAAVQMLVDLFEQVKAREAYSKLSKEEKVAVTLRWGGYLQWYRRKMEEKRIRDEIKKCTRRIKSLEQELLEQC